MSAWTTIQHFKVPSGGQSSIVLNNIPQLYDDLFIKASLRTTSSNFYDDLDITFNGETARSWRGLYYVPTSVASNAGAFNIVGASPGASVTASTFNNMEIYIPTYKSSNIKTMLSDSIIANNSASSHGLVINANTVTNSAAITTITISHSFGTYTFVENSSVTLYGIARGSAGGVTVS